MKLLTFGLRQTVSLLLMAVGTLLLGVGAAGALSTPPAGVNPTVQSSMTRVFGAMAVIGLAFLAWGFYLRSTLRRGNSGLLWVTYALFVLPLFALAIYVQDDVRRVLGTRGIFQNLETFLLFAVLLLGPVIIWFRRPGPSSPNTDHNHNQERRV